MNISKKGKFLIKLLKIVVPIGLIYYIFTIIDFEKFIEVIRGSDFLLLLLVAFSVPVQYLLFTARWSLLMYIIEDVKIKFSNLHSILYKGLFVGFFVPGGIGIDVYRVISVWDKYKIYKSNFSTIFLEKIIGTLSSLVLAFLCYPFLSVESNPILANIIFYLKYLIGGFLFLFLILIINKLIFKRNTHPFIQRILNYLNGSIIKLFNRISINDFQVKPDSKIVTEILKPVLSYRNIFIVLIFSISILIVKAVFMNIAFRAIGYDVPLIINLFLIPLINIISLVPISFGGVGVRESSTVFLYSIFFVPPESSFAVALISFSFVLVNIVFGGLMMIKDGFLITKR